MTDKLLNERELSFQLYEMLDTEALLQRPRYAEHDRAVFDATLETARSIAAEYLAPHNHKGDANEPTFDQVYNQINEERMNMRARRYLRDLRRDAVIEFR